MVVRIANIQATPQMGDFSFKHYLVLFVIMLEWLDRQVLFFHGLDGQADGPGPVRGGGIGYFIFNGSSSYNFV